MAKNSFETEVPECQSEVALGNATATPNCLHCGNALPQGRARIYCSDACRVTSWKRKKRQVVLIPQIPKGRSRKETGIYECPACETRYLGIQYCDDCGTFCRRIGSGGSCPHCNEPVAFVDLVEI